MSNTLGRGYHSTYWPIGTTHTTVSSGARHPQAEAIGESLDNLVRLAQEYKAYMEERVGQDAANPSPFPGVDRALSEHVSRIHRFIEILDNDVLDQFR